MKAAAVDAPAGAWSAVAGASDASYSFTPPAIGGTQKFTFYGNKRRENKVDFAQQQKSLALDSNFFHLASGRSDFNEAVDG